MHAGRVEPVKVRARDDELRVAVLRVVGYRATCSCEWRGSVRRTVAAARVELADHRLEVAAP